MYDKNLMGDFAPNLQVLNTFHVATPYRFTTNAQGLRNLRDIPREKGEGVFRILCLGDSFTMGWGVDDEDAYPEVLYRILSARFPDFRFEVANAGNIWSNVLDQIDYFREKGKALRPDLVISQFYVNDILHEMAREVVSRQALRLEARSGSFRRKLDALLGKTSLYRLAAMLRVRFEKIREKGYMDGRNVPGEAAARIPDDDVNGLLVRPDETEATCARKKAALFLEENNACLSRFWNNYLRGVDLLEKEVRESGAQFLFLAVPDRSNTANYFNAHACAFSERFSRPGAAYLDMTPVFRSLADDDYERFYIPDGHAAPLGQRLMAESVADAFLLYRSGQGKTVFELKPPLYLEDCGARFSLDLAFDGGAFSLAPSSGDAPEFSSEVLASNMTVSDDGAFLRRDESGPAPGAVALRLTFSSPQAGLDVISNRRIFNDPLGRSSAALLFGTEEGEARVLYHYRSNLNGTWNQSQQTKISELRFPEPRKEIFLKLVFTGQAGVLIRSRGEKDYPEVFRLVFHPAKPGMG